MNRAGKMDMIGNKLWKLRIREWALDLGFAAVGFSRAVAPEGLSELLKKRLQQDLAVPWENKDIHLRTNPQAGWPECRTVIALAFPLPYSSPPRKGEGVIARFAVGEDYHYLLKKKIAELAGRMEESGWTGAWRWQVDTGPLN